MNNKIRILNVKDKHNLEMVIRLANLIGEAETAEKNITLKELYKKFVQKATEITEGTELFELDDLQIACILLIFGTVTAKDGKGFQDFASKLGDIIETLITREEAGALLEEIVKISAKDYYLYSCFDSSMVPHMGSSIGIPYVTDPSNSKAFTNIMKVGYLSYTEFNSKQNKRWD